MMERMGKSRQASGRPGAISRASTGGVDITVVADMRCQTGECPIWHPGDGGLYWTDIPAGCLYCYHPDTGRTETVYRGRPVGGMTLQGDGALLLFRDGGNVAIWRRGKTEETIVEKVPALADTRFNDVCADPAGRVFCGTMRGAATTGRLYQLARCGKLTLLDAGFGTPNGMGFSPDGRRLYFNDSRKARTWRFDYNLATGVLGTRSLCRDAVERKDPGRPDGLAVDSEGGIWTGRWEGGALLRFDSRMGKITHRIDLPARMVTSLCFAGEGLHDIYATTAGGHERESAGPGAGMLFRIRGVGLAGLARYQSFVGIKPETRNKQDN